MSEVVKFLSENPAQYLATVVRDGKRKITEKRILHIDKWLKEEYNKNINSVRRIEKLRKMNFTVSAGKNIL